MAHHMTENEWRAFLSEGTRTGKVATVRADGSPHIAPVWFLLDGDDLVFNTGRDTVKGRNLAREGRVSVCVDDDRPPFAFAVVQGRAALSEDLAEVRDWATRIAARSGGGRGVRRTQRCTRRTPRTCKHGEGARDGRAGRLTRPRRRTGPTVSPRSGLSHGVQEPGGVHPPGVLDRTDQDFFPGSPVARVAQDDRCPRVEVECPRHVVLAVGPGSREAVDGDDERMRRCSKWSTAGKQPSSRRVSVSTTAPSAPWDSSSHRNQKRSWPGVPNR
ncbi:PPOX class probable F420-dependent enzyme [Streptomyces sp. B1I3]|nr:PPOX class probable F420-dependent enzyme [Streptomyces sp. B1I3]